MGMFSTSRRAFLSLGAMALAALAGSALSPVTARAADAAHAPAAPKTLQLPMRTDGPKTLDPAQGSTQYDNIAVSMVYETLVTFSYAKPSELEPLLLSEMPARSEDGLTIRFKLKPGARFADDACFPGGKGRAITPEDVFYSLKRLADKRLALKNWWLLDGQVVGLNEFKDQQNANLDAGKAFDYDAPVAGFVKISDTEFEIKLTKPVYRFLYTLAQFQTSVVPREAVEKYADQFGAHPVGTGPFVLDQWQPKTLLHLNKNPNYHDVKYPARDQWSREDRRRRLDRAAGQSVPFVDRVEFTMFVQDQPMWLQFQAGNLGYIEVPSDYFEQAFDKRTREVKSEFTAQGITDHKDLLLDFIFVGFNMEDPLIGGLAPEKIALRQAVSLALDHNEINEVIYNGTNYIYDGPIPPNMDGFPENGKAPKNYRGPDRDRALEKLKEAGWPEGKNAQTGQPLTLTYYTDVSARNTQTAELYKRQLARVGIRLEVVQIDFSTLIQYVDNKKAQVFGFAWGSDYPDAENNLALFYGPNQSPGSNHYNYKNPEYDAMYEKILVMSPGPERTKMYEQMRDLLIEHTPYVGSMCRTRFYLMAPWIVNCRPTERTWSWLKYLDVDEAKRK